MTPEQALHQAIQNDEQLHFLRAHQKEIILSKPIKMIQRTDGFTTKWEDDPTQLEEIARLIQQRIDELTRHYLP